VLSRIADRIPGADPAGLRQAADSGLLAEVELALPNTRRGNMASLESITSALEQALT
jgi:hypothetical protein